MLHFHGCPANLRQNLPSPRRGHTQVFSETMDGFLDALERFILAEAGKDGEEDSIYLQTGCHLEGAMATTSWACGTTGGH